MRLFSRHHQPQQHQTTSEKKLYVFIRSPDISSEDEPKWSIAVSQTHHLLSALNPSIEGHQRTKQKKSFLPFTNRQNPKHDIHPRNPQPSPPQTTTLHEFMLSDGTLRITQHQPNPHPNRSESLLLAIQLPPPPQRPSSPSPQALHLQIEQSLHRLTSTTAHFADSDTPTWLKLALIAFQHEKHLPQATGGFNVERFMDFARNSWTGFEGEVLRMDGSDGSGFDDGGGGLVGRELVAAMYVKNVDYMRHVAENERLMAMVGGQ